MRKDLRKESFPEIVRTKFKKPLGYLIWIVVFLLTLSIIKNINKVSRVKEEIDREKARIAKIEAENRELEQKVALTNSPQFVEKEIRNKLGLVKTGEVIVVLPDEETLKKLAPPIKDNADYLPDPNWKKWIKLFSD
jgi:cell division protein FtsB